MKTKTRKAIRHFGLSTKDPYSVLYHKLFSACGLACNEHATLKRRLVTCKNCRRTQNFLNK